MPYPDTGRRIPVSIDGGVGPIWSHDGRELYYIQVKDREKNMMAVQIGSDPNFPVGVPEQLFVLDGPYSTAANLGRTYDISQSGRFLMLRRAEDKNIQLICIQNWFEELKQLAPTEKGD